MKIRRLIKAEDVILQHHGKTFFIRNSLGDEAVFSLEKRGDYYWIRDNDQDKTDVIRLKPANKKCSTGGISSKYHIPFSEEDLNES